MESGGSSAVSHTMDTAAVEQHAGGDRMEDVRRPSRDSQGSRLPEPNGSYHVMPSDSVAPPPLSGSSSSDLSETTHLLHALLAGAPPPGLLAAMPGLPGLPMLREFPTPDKFMGGVLERPSSQLGAVTGSGDGSLFQQQLRAGQQSPFAAPQNLWTSPTSFNPFNNYPTYFLPGTFGNQFGTNNPSLFLSGGQQGQAAGNGESAPANPVMDESSLALMLPSLLSMQQMYGGMPMFPGLPQHLLQQLSGRPGGLPGMLPNMAGVLDPSLSPGSLQRQQAPRIPKPKVVLENGDVQCSGSSRKTRKQCRNAALKEYIGERPKFCAAHVNLDPNSLYAKCRSESGRACCETVLKEFVYCFKHFQSMIDTLLGQGQAGLAEMNSLHSRCCEHIGILEMEHRSADSTESAELADQRKKKLLRKFKVTRKMLKETLVAHGVLEPTSSSPKTSSAASTSSSSAPALSSPASSSPSPSSSSPSSSSSSSSSSKSSSKASKSKSSRSAAVKSDVPKKRRRLGDDGSAAATNDDDSDGDNVGSAVLSSNHRATLEEAMLLSALSQDFGRAPSPSPRSSSGGRSPALS